MICKLTLYFASLSVFDYIYISRLIHTYIDLYFNLILHLNRFSTCSCDLPHTLRCDGDLPDGEKKAEVVSLLDYLSFAKVMSSYLRQSNYQCHNYLLLVRLLKQCIFSVNLKPIYSSFKSLSFLVKYICTMRFTSWWMQ